MSSKIQNGLLFVTCSDSDASVLCLGWVKDHKVCSIENYKPIIDLLKPSECNTVNAEVLDVATKTISSLGN